MLYIYSIDQGTFLKQLLKKTLKRNQENPNIEGSLCW